MFVLTQDKTIVNLANSSFTKAEKVDNIYRIITQVGYFNDLKSGLAKPIVEVLGEYETRDDADYALDKILGGLFAKSDCLVMPPFNTDEDGM